MYIKPKIIRRLYIHKQYSICMDNETKEIYKELAEIQEEVEEINRRIRRIMDSMAGYYREGREGTEDREQEDRAYLEAERSGNIQADLDYAEDSYIL